MRELQKILRDLGYDQPLTGTFAEHTEANVKDFQRRHGIEAKGVVGPQTRQALLVDNSSATPPIPDIPQSGYSTGPCTQQQCTLYLRRSTTHRYAQLIAAHPFAANGVSSAIVHLACAVLKRSIAALLCEFTSEYFLARPITNALTAADRQHACLRITLSLTNSSPLTATTDNTNRCKD